jgi:3-ketosteroid 9alpha-monooxygenase subunit A
MAFRELVERSEVAYMAKPAGWFQIGWSHEYEIGTVKPIKYFGQDLVAYRTEDGVLRVVDAHCPHFGAHLGFGGKVEGNCLRCPFHGWTWGPDGRNQEIPYSTKKNTTKQLIGHPIEERNGIIYMWHSPVGDDPVGEPPVIAELTDEESHHSPYPEACKLWGNSRLFPQFILENNVDYAHVKYLHEWDAIPVAEPIEVTDESFRTVFSGELETKQGRTPMRLVTVAYGVGLIVSRMYGIRGAASVIGTTPIDDLHSDVRVTVAVERSEKDGDSIPPVVHGIRKAQLITTFEQDIPVWGNMKYNVTPPFPREEAHDFIKMRKWAKRFYPQLDKNVEPATELRTAQG